MLKFEALSLDILEDEESLALFCVEFAKRVGVDFKEVNYRILPEVNRIEIWHGDYSEEYRKYLESGDTKRSPNSKIELP